MPGIGAKRRVLTVAGLAAMVAGALLPWASVHASIGSSNVAGFGHGAEYLLALTALAALLSFARVRVAAGLCAAVAAALLVLVMYQLPGTLVATGEVYEANVGPGVFTAFAGACVAAFAAWLGDRRHPVHLRTERTVCA
jgi:hypothetical protein